MEIFIKQSIAPESFIHSRRLPDLLASVNSPFASVIVPLVDLLHIIVIPRFNFGGSLTIFLRVAVFRLDAALASLRAAVGLGDKIPQHANQGSVTRQIIIKLGRYALHFRQPRVWNVRKVVVLVVVANVEEQQVQRAVVRVSCVAVVEEIVLRNKMSREGMKPEAKEAP